MTIYQKAISTMLLIVPLLIAAVGSTACTTHKAMERSARVVADQVAQLELELQQEARAESTYVDSTLDDIDDAIQRSRAIRLEQLLDRDARKFAAGKDTAAVDDGEIVAFMQAAVEGWQSTESELQTQLDDVHSRLMESRQGIDVRTGELAKLQGRFMLLGKARTKKQLAQFILGYVDQTAAKVAERKEETP